ncbi:MAG TPA: transcriptional repressor [Ignavibacteria bacterium]
MKKEEIKNIFIKYLKDNSHRITNERLLILDSALSMRDHFDADELYLKMKGDYIRASRATVYKTLELMSECSILTKHNFKGDRARYETKYGRNHHYHIICVRCNRIVEFEDPRIEKLQETICKEHNLKLVDHTLQVFAVCNDKEKCIHKNLKLKNQKSK